LDKFCLCFAIEVAGNVFVLGRVKPLLAFTKTKLYRIILPSSRQSNYF